MKAFVDLRALPQENTTGYESGIYIFMEVAIPNSDQEEMRRSQLFVPLVKKESDLPALKDTHNELHFVNINNLRAPAVVVSDLGNENKRAHLRMLPMWQWGRVFDDWLHQTHNRDWEIEPDNT